MLRSCVISITHNLNRKQRMHEGDDYMMRSGSFKGLKNQTVKLRTVEVAVKLSMKLIILLSFTWFV